MGGGGVETVSFVAGRSSELEAVRSVFDGALQGSASALFVAGEPGIGKTSLVRRACEDMADIEILWVQCLPLTLLATPLLPLRTALRHVPGAPQLDGAHPVLSFDDWLDDVTARRPLAMVVDDIQWADQSTLDVVMCVLAGDPERQLAVIVTRRVDDGEAAPHLYRWLADAHRLPRTRRLTLNRLDRAATGEQLAMVLGSLPHESLVDDVYARSGGNPYLTSLLARTTTAVATELPLGLPDGLREAVVCNWQQLSRAARDLTSLLAVAGQPERFDRLRQVARLVGFADPLLPLLDEAVEAGVLRVDADHDYWFSHPLVPELLAAQLLHEKRQALHAAFAEALEPDSSDLATADVDRTVSLADHYFHAGLTEPAYQWALRAAHAAKRMDGPPEALRLLRRARELWPSVAEPGMSLRELRYGIRWAAEQAGDDSAELQAVEELLTGADQPIDASEAAELLSRRAELRRTTGIEFLGLDDLREAVRVSERCPGSPGHAMAVALLAQAEIWIGLHSGQKRAREAVRLARANEPGRALVYALITRAMAWYDLEDPAGADNAREAFEIAMRIPITYERVLAVFWIAMCSFEARSAREIVDLFRSCRERLTAARLAHPYLARLATEEAIVLLDLGLVRDCAERLRFCLGSRCGPMADTKMRLTFAQLASRQGRNVEAAAHLARAEEIFADQSGFLPLDFDWVRAELAAATGDTDRVVAALADAERAGKPLFRILPLAARALADCAERMRDRGENPTPVLNRLTALRERHRNVDPRPRGYKRYKWAKRDAQQAMYDVETSRARRTPDIGSLASGGGGLRQGRDAMGRDLLPMATGSSRPRQPCTASTSGRSLASSAPARRRAWLRAAPGPDRSPSAGCSHIVDVYPRRPARQPLAGTDPTGTRDTVIHHVRPNVCRDREDTVRQRKNGKRARREHAPQDWHCQPRRTRTARPTPWRAITAITALALGGRRADQHGLLSGEMDRCRSRGRKGRRWLRNSLSSPFRAGYTRWMPEIPLLGGNTTGAVLIDGVVHKRASPWTATVHALLRYLEDAGFDSAPRALGFDQQGREMLTFLPGETIGDRDPSPDWARNDSMLAQVGQWLRRVHDLTSGFTPPADERWFIGGTMQPGLVVGHQDAAPYNAVVDGGRLVGFCDWDIAGPSPREWDLAFSALTWVPLASPRDGTPLSSNDLRERSRRLHLLLDAYGYEGDRRGFGAVVTQRAERQAGVMRSMADAGDAASIALLPIAELLERSATDVQALPDDFWAH